MKTLQDVYLRIPLLYSESSAKAYAAAFRRVERLTGRRLHQIPANDVAWSDLAGRIIWAGEFKAATPQASERAFDAWRAKIAAAIRMATSGNAVAQGEPDIAQAWERLIAYAREVENVTDAVGRRVLPNMSSVSLANLQAQLGHVPPGRIDFAIAAEALTRIPADKAAAFRHSLRFLDGMIARRDRHAPVADLLPAAEIGPLPTIRDKPLDWTKFSETFLAARDAAIRRAIVGSRHKPDRFGGKLGADPLPNRQREGRRRRSPVRNSELRATAFRGALSWLVRHAFPDRTEAYSAASLQDVLTVARVEAAVEGFRQRVAQSPFLKAVNATASLWTYLGNLRCLADQNGFDPDVIDRIGDLQFDPENYSDHAAEMSASRADFVKLLNRDPAVARAIVTGPARLMREVQQKFAAWDNLNATGRSEALHLSMAATMLAIQLARPLRTRNINDMTSGGEAPELIAPSKETVAPWLEIGRNRVKNRRFIENPIPAWLWTIIQVWLEVGRHRWCIELGISAESNDHLFPGTRSGAPVSRGLLNKAWNRGMSRLGLPGLTPHMMRHVAATLFLARNPGNYGVVAESSGRQLANRRGFLRPRRGPGGGPAFC